MNNSPLNVSIVFGVDQTRAKPDYVTMTLHSDKTLNGWGANKRGVKIRGKEYIVEVFVIREMQTELELSP